MVQKSKLFPLFVSEMFRRVVLLFFFLCSLYAHAQKNKNLSTFFKAVQSKSSDLISYKNLHKARSFFLQKEWDSTLLYAAKHIDANILGRRKNDYAHFFKAYSLRRKKLFKESGQEFTEISKKFDFYERVFVYMGGVELELEKYESAINNYQLALQSIAMESMIGVKKTTLQNNIGLCYLHLEEYKKADEYLLKSIKGLEEKGDTLKMIGSYGNLANLYYERKLDNKAILYFKKAYDLAQYSTNFDLKRRMAKNMAVVEEGRRDFAKALIYRKEYEKWKDSLNDQNRIYETAQLEKKIAVEQKQKEVTVLQAENKLKEERNKVYLYSGVLLLVLLVILFTSYKGKVKRNKIITAQKEDLDLLNATKDKLFSIVSHDLRSSVNAIKTSNKRLLNNLESESANNLKETLQQNSSIVNGAYGLLDNLLNWALLQTKQSYFEMTELHLSHIVEHVAYNYQPLMLDKKIAFENSISKKTAAFADQESFKIILRNLLDNAIKFTKSGGMIQIYTKDSDEKYVRFVVEDSGIGMDKAIQNELLKDTQMLSKKKHEDVLGTGLGLHLIKSMVKKNKGIFTIESELGKGTKIIISLLKSPPNGLY